jgi:F5/8 type C domain-containing protein
VTTTAEAAAGAARVSRRAIAAAACAYLLIGAVYTHPVLQRSFTGIANDPYDPILNASILWWNATTVPFSAEWWSPPHFHPTQDVAAFTENLVGVSVLATPVYWLTGSALAAYNVCFAISWPLSAFTAYLLALFLVRRHDAAFLAGLAWGFTPYRTAELGHLQMLSVYWFPPVLLGLHGYLEERRVRWLVLFGVAWVVQSLANGYFLLFGAVVVGLWLLYFCVRRDAWRALPGILLTWTIANLALLPVLLRYREIHDRFGLHRTLNEVMWFSAQPAAWFETSSVVWLWRHLLRDSKDDLFPGVTVVLVAAAGIVLAVRAAFRGRPPSTPRRRAIVAALLAAVGLSLAAMLSVIAWGPWSRTLAGVTLRMSDLDRAVGVAIWCGVLAIALTPALRAAVARRSVLLFYAAMTVVLAILCYGPAMRRGEVMLLEPMPYRWLMYLPGFNGVRVPTRFWMLGLLCLAIVAGIAFARYAPAAVRRRRVVFAAIAVGILLDGWTVGIGMPDAPPQWPKVERRDRTEAVIELPLGPSWDAAATFRAVRHRRRVVNGVSGYDPQFYAPLQDGLNSYEPSVLTSLASFGAIDIVVNGEADPDGAWARYASAVAGEPVAADGVRRVYRLPHIPAPSVVLGPTIPIVAVTASGADGMEFVRDGRLDTEWHDNPRQLTGHWLMVDLGSVHPVAGVTLLHGEWARDFPRRLAIDVSADGVSWSVAWRGPTVAQAMAAAVAGPLRCEVRLAFAEQQARYVRLRAEADHKNLWRIAEISVHAR